MLKDKGPKVLLGRHSGVFLKPLRPKDKANLEKAVQGTLVLSDSDPVQIDLRGWYGSAITSSRSWWFRFNQLPTLGWAAGVWDCSSHGHKFIEFNFDVIHNWAKKSVDQLPLKWHDHASALRMKNMADWYITVCNHSSEYDEELEVLADLVNEHLRWLCEEKNYSGRTNHGFEQARLMLAVASELPGLPSSEEAKALALTRLQDEIRFGFTGQGVHKENSPGYQWFMIKIMQETKDMLDRYGVELHEVDFNKIINRAKRFLDAIALPDNSLPLIGDTIHKDKQNAYVAKLRRKLAKDAGVNVYDYSKSGYGIVKDLTDPASPIHIVFKNGHLSDYHRQNDDLSVHFTKGSTVLFGDGGLYSHNQNDKGRRYAKSAWAHSTVFPVNFAEKRIKRKHLKRKPKLKRANNSSFIGSTWLYHPDSVLQREISWEALLGLSDIRILDSLLQGSSHIDDRIVSTFIVPKDKLDIVIGEEDIGLVRFRLDRLECKISFNPDEVIPGICEGIDASSEKLSGYSMVSPTMGEVVPATRISFSWKKGISQAHFRVRVLTEEELQECRGDCLHLMEYRGYGPINITSSDWFFDGKYPGNVCHHIMSLRWLSELSEPQAKRIVSSFINYHREGDSKKGKNYLGRAADHTAGVRMEILLELTEKHHDDDQFVSDVRAELLKTIWSCLHETYKKKNNHGLMVDVAILRCFFRDKFVFDKFGHKLPLVIARIEQQLDAIFDEEGYCKEHSVSYQEYNLGIVLNLFDVLAAEIRPEVAEVLKRLHERVEHVKNASRKSLGFLLKDDGYYIPIGDSFPKPKSSILEKAFGGKSPRDSLMPDSIQDGIFYSETLGVSVFRFHDLHMVLNACWHSYVHKQNDDLSIFLRANGEDVFLDGGYSDLIPREVVDVRSEYLHSCITVEGCEWLQRNKVDLGSSIVYPPQCGEREGVIVFSGKNSRIPNVNLYRKVFVETAGWLLELHDSCEGVPSFRRVRHRFLINYCFDIEVKERLVTIRSYRNSIQMDVLGDQPVEIKVDKTKVVKDGQLGEVNVLDFLSQGEAGFSVRITPAGSNSISSQSKSSTLKRV